ncbi:hypothetical protein LK07_28130 [Streptomyces pluripotens]|uniref:PPM-type phosphatase domain-containing protein n=1 Tax=Streptomyces pluripotens TaxID=1355015 RepID=A0A221P4Q3_9ACTN|nr:MULTISPECIES: protein phosphatase 2C domain-containing protein [Streptomyces]ARP73011.1 hypothetical protein LK06_026965 [Streptomyces pluripotens]ASN27263.1 hypothetical protein LK07_28130 [Streptomyces pluripotens]KIE28742.1 hypothetical protein LK08_01705 [Streptomyces sp. MUSC 125]MCH0557922.1 protein phosphatase 2C domain-containing protein [Streptomyces sp. MUM 16J]
MSQQGGRVSRHEDDWWGQLYDDSTEDTGPTAASDSLDDRFASAKNTVAGRPAQTPAHGAEPAGRGGDGEGDGRGDGGDAGRRVAREPAVPAQRAAQAPSATAAAGRNTSARPVSAGSAQPASPGGPAAPADPPPAPTEPLATISAPTDYTIADGTGTDYVGTDYVGTGPPTYDPEPAALPAADPDGLGELVPDTVLDGARYGACTLRAASLRGDSARYRGEPRRDALLTARFGTGEQALVLVAMATGARATPGAHLAAAEACRWIGRAVGRSQQRLVEDIRAARRGDLKSGLHRLTDRSLGRLRTSAAEQGVHPDEYTASLRCLLLPADPACHIRVFFGIGGGGLFRLRDGEWQDIEPQAPVVETGSPAVGGSGSPAMELPEGDPLTTDLGIPSPSGAHEPAPGVPRAPFRFRASPARSGDALVMCTEGLSDALRGEPALCAYLARRWSRPGRDAPGLAAFLADAQVRVKGYADDRTAAAVWES